MLFEDDDVFSIEIEGDTENEDDVAITPEETILSAERASQ